MADPTSSPKPQIIAVLGGYGTFGARVVDMLADDAITLWVAGRSKKKADAFCARFTTRRATVCAVRIDRNSRADLDDLFALKPDIVIDASGPWQAYGDEPYRLVHACITHRVHYLDLADSTAFVAGIRQFDAAARAFGVTVLSGVSSFPVLTAAALRHITRDYAQIHAIYAGIAPSPYAGFGTNVIRAICHYAGKPVQVMKHGRWTAQHTFTSTRRFTVAPPGVEPLDERLFGLIDVPDLRVLPDQFPGVQHVWVGVAPVPSILFRGLILAAALVRFKLLPGLGWASPLVKLATDHLRWGAHRGGMFVEAWGRKADGQPVRRTWHMIAEGEDGPKIPSMAIPAIIGRWIDGTPPEPGARAAAAELEIAEYQRLFTPLAITTGVTDHPVPKAI